MDILSRLDEERRTINVLEHPFYLRWSAGTLSAHELRCYGAQYRHAVVALAQTSIRAADEANAEQRAGLQHHAEEEAGHVALWDQFARTTGASQSQLEAAPALPQTLSCVDAWIGGDDLLERLGVLYVLEAGQPEISRTKLTGLEAHYGYRPEGPATEYFRVHSSRDEAHARAAAVLIDELMVGVEDAEQREAALVHRASAALHGNWQLLSGVEETALGDLRRFPVRLERHERTRPTAPASRPQRQDRGRIRCRP